jgi:hypothetical protein
MEWDKKIPLGRRDKFGWLGLRQLEVGGKGSERIIHRRDAENAE